jgi:hypothetical protein
LFPVADLPTLATDIQGVSKQNATEIKQAVVHHKRG